MVLEHSDRDLPHHSHLIMVGGKMHLGQPSRATYYRFDHRGILREELDVKESLHENNSGEARIKVGHDSV